MAGCRPRRFRLSSPVLRRQRARCHGEGTTVSELLQQEITHGQEATTTSVQRRPHPLHHQVVIVGGGTGGIAVASRLRRSLPSAEIAIIEPSDRHYYQPL